jgi:rod shape-determining protein MreC
VVELSHDSRPIIGRDRPLGAAFLALAAVSVALMVADQRYDQLERLREALESVAYPLQRAVDFPFRAWDRLTGSFADRGRLREENLELTARLRLANLQLQRFAALEDENRRLRDMRERSAGVADRVLVASIINVELDPFRHRVLVDKGEAHGVFKGQAVLDAEGIFGQVSKVHARSAEVILISDVEHAIPVQSNRSGLRSIAVGTGDAARLSLPFITVESDLKAGDLLISTGLGGVFPSGYPVAEVTRVERSPAATFAVVDARPTALLERNREVLLVWFESAQPATAESAVAPAEAPLQRDATAGAGSAQPATPSPPPAGTGAATTPAPPPASTGAATTPAPRPAGNGAAAGAPAPGAVPAAGTNTAARETPVADEVPATREAPAAATPAGEAPDASAAAPATEEPAVTTEPAAPAPAAPPPADEPPPGGETP